MASVAGISLAAPWAAAAAYASEAAELSDVQRKLQQDYDGYSTKYDELDGGAAGEALGIPEMRKVLLAGAAGDVLEVAVGTGLNLPFYDASAVASLVGLDLSEGMLSQAALKAGELEAAGKGLGVRLVQGDAQRMPFEDGSFDTVVDTFSMCVFRDPAAAVAEMARVVRPGGRVLLLENARADGLLGAYQDVTNSAVEKMSRGCAWNQRVADLARGAGLRVVEERKALGGLVRAVIATTA